MVDDMITRTRPEQPARGFTLTELLVVILIIGILITFILIAARDSVQTAQKKATLSLITKLETGLNERIEAILAQRGEVTPAHEDIAAMYLSSGVGIGSPQRSQVIAQFDQVRAEVPDVFVINPAPLNARYPFNFAGIPYPLAGNTYDYFVLPLGKGLTFVPGTGYVPTTPRTPGTGIFGASYTAAAGIYKNLGYLPEGYDGVDNDNDGFVDDWNEGIGNDPLVSDPDNIAGPQVRLSVLINSRLRNHTHNTARAEMLYALLVEGQGPLGSVFSREDFTESEVRDTDHDGLPEFVDAWGQPLRFYRWPIFYSPTNISNSGGNVAGYIQKGPGPYGSQEVRQNDPLDPAQLLVAPSWWWSQVNVNPPNTVRFSSAGFSAVGTKSASAVAFMTYFHSLLDPQPAWLNATPLPGQSWDRASFLQRRAYYSRPLIISAGPDEMLGVAELGTDYRTLVPPTLDLFTSSDNSGAPLGVSALSVMQIENLASQYDPNHFLINGSTRYGQINNAPFNQTDQFLSGSAGLDDISNHSLSSPGAGVR
jgi:prepilin-type N-terminal cleavage/methylation domain-containing protein